MASCLIRTCVQWEGIKSSIEASHLPKGSSKYDHMMRLAVNTDRRKAILKQYRAQIGDSGRASAPSLLCVLQGIATQTKNISVTTTLWHDIFKRDKQL